MTPMRMCFSNESLSAEFVRALSIDAKYFTLQCMGRHSDDLVYYQVISSLPADFLGDCVEKAGLKMDLTHENEEGYEWWWLPTGGYRDPPYMRMYFEHDEDAQFMQARLGDVARLVFEETPENDHVRYYRVTETTLSLKKIKTLIQYKLAFDCGFCWGIVMDGRYRDPPEPIETAPGSVQMAV